MLLQHLPNSLFWNLNHPPATRRSSTSWAVAEHEFDCQYCNMLCMCLQIQVDTCTHLQCLLTNIRIDKNNQSANLFIATTLRPLKKPFFFLSGGNSLIHYILDELCGGREKTLQQSYQSPTRGCAVSSHFKPGYSYKLSNNVSWFNDLLLSFHLGGKCRSKVESRTQN